MHQPTSDSTPIRVTRRRALGHLVNAVGLLALGGCTGDRTQRTSKRLDATVRALNLPKTKYAGLPFNLNPEDFHIHNRSPLALETKRKQMPSTVITPIEKLFVRNNLPRPPEHFVSNPDTWSLKITGVKKPTTLTVKQLKALGDPTSRLTVLQCSGNGRAFFEHGASGSQWSTGAAGCVKWTGVMVSDILDHLGGSLPNARYLTGTGGEPLPGNVDRDDVIVERSIPLTKGLKDCLLAWAMNDMPLPLSHGGPLRLVVPGYFGCNQIKYLNHLHAGVEQSTAKIQQTGYRFRPIGQKGNATQPSMWRMPVKSWFLNAHTTETPKGQYSITLHGVAFSGERGVRSVEFSIDGGEQWTPVVLRKTNHSHVHADAWLTFDATCTLPKGEHLIVCRATDTEGDVQPKNRIENERGYGHNGWLDHGLTVFVDIEPTDDHSSSQSNPGLNDYEQLSSSSIERGRTLFTSGTSPGCGTCHTLKDAGTAGQIGPNLDTLQPQGPRIERAINNGVGAMPRLGHQLNPSDLKHLTKYIEFVTRK